MPNPSPKAALREKFVEDLDTYDSLRKWRERAPTASSQFIDEAMQLFDAYAAGLVVRARIDTITKILGVKTEGLFDDGDLFIKRAPIEQEIVNMVGYETFKAIQEAVDAKLTPPEKEEI